MRLAGFVLLSLAGLALRADAAPLHRLEWRTPFAYDAYYRQGDEFLRPNPMRFASVRRFESEMPKGASGDDYAPCIQSTRGSCDCGAPVPWHAY